MVVDSKGSVHASQTAFIYILPGIYMYVCILYVYVADNSHCLYIPPFNLDFLLVKLHVYIKPLLRGWRQSDPWGVVMVIRALLLNIWRQERYRSERCISSIVRL